VALLGDLSAIPIDSESVDIVLNIQVLEHVTSPAQILREIHRVLKPGGTLYLTAPQGWHEHQSPHDYFRFTREALQLLFEEAGFPDPKIESQGGYFHYLGHRLTYIPKVLFGSRSGLLRGLFFPLELLSLSLFCFCLPVLCYYLDRLDSRQEFTLGYRCVVVKEAVSVS
jgi:SAM-dependent methyltransferase